MREKKSAGRRAPCQHKDRRYMSDSTKWMGISTAGERDGRRNDPRSSAPLSDRAFQSLTLSSRSSAGQLYPGSARTPRNHTRARFSGRNRRPACALGRERKEAPKNETKPVLFHTPHTTSFSPSSRLRSTRLILSWEQQSWQFKASRTAHRRCRRHRRRGGSGYRLRTL